MLLFLIFSCISLLLNALGLNLPNYIGQCSLSDPNLNRCIIEKANAAIPTIAKGDVVLPIPSVSPLNVSKISLKVDDLEMEWFHVYTDDMKNYRLKEVGFVLLPNDTSFQEGYINQFTMSGKNYNIISGNVVGIPVSGSGNFNVTLIGVTIRTTPVIKQYQKGDEVYIDVPVEPIQVEVVRAYYYFENIQSPSDDDVNAYIEENWEEFTQQIMPALGAQLSAFITYPVYAILSKVPLLGMLSAVIKLRSAFNRA